jgi:hypothetical protein
MKILAVILMATVSTVLAAKAKPDRQKALVIDQPHLSGDKLPSCRPSARNQCAATGRTQTIHCKWAPHWLIA